MIGIMVKIQQIQIITKWTQWIFEQMYEKLTYEAGSYQSWVPELLGTVISNEEVIIGKSERGSYDVIRKLCVNGC